MFERLGRIAGNGEESPGEFARLRVVGREVPAQPELRTALADEDLAVHRPGRPGNRVGVVGRVVGGIDVPDLLPGRLVEGDEPGVEGRKVELAFVGGHATVRRPAAAGVAHRIPVGLRVEAPDLLARLGVHRVGDAPRIGEIHDAIDHQRRRLLAKRVVQILDPRETENSHGVAVDLREGGKPQFVVGLAMGQPASGFRFAGGDDPGFVNPTRRTRLLCRFRGSSVLGSLHGPDRHHGRYGQEQEPRTQTQRHHCIPSQCKRSVGCYPKARGQGEVPP